MHRLAKPTPNVKCDLALRYSLGAISLLQLIHDKGTGSDPLGRPLPRGETQEQSQCIEQSERQTSPSQDERGSK